MCIKASGKTQTNLIVLLQAELQRADKEQVVMADKAKADTEKLQACISTMKGELANHKQAVQDQQRNLQAASCFEPQLNVLQEQLEEAVSSKADVTKVNVSFILV